MKGKNIIVTGATSGIGLGVCEALLKEGSTVFGIGREITKLNGLLIPDLAGRLILKSFDLSNIDSIERLIDDFTRANGKIDGFVHCAGMEETVPLSVLKKEKVQNIFNINVFSAIELLRVVTKKRNSNDSSSVVFLSSIMGKLGQSGKIGYCSTKAALLGVVKASALELVRRKIRVNAVLPGIVKTPLTQRLFTSLSEDNIQDIIGMHPLGLGEIEDVVPAILFLLSENSKWITGQSIVIDGGYSIH